MRRVLSQTAAVAIGLTLAACSAQYPASSNTREESVGLLNVSNDPTRELWSEMNADFVKDYEEKNHQSISVKQSHGGSSSQARAVIDGLGADVVTLAMETDIDAISKAGLIDSQWRERLPNRSVPYFSTIVFVVRKGNPKSIKDWPDLGQTGIEVITPNPKTSGNGKLSFVGTWGSVLVRGGTENEARALVERIYSQTPVLDTAARSASTTFAQRGIGDVHLTWESEAHLEVAEAGGSLEIVYPPVSIKAEPPVAWVDAVVKRKQTEGIAKAYLEYTYTEPGQRIFAKHYYRPTNPVILQEFSERFPEIQFFGIEAVAPNWEEANKRFFASGGVFEQIYTGDAGRAP